MTPGDWLRALNPATRPAAATITVELREPPPQPPAIDSIGRKPQTEVVRCGCLAIYSKCYWPDQHG